MSTNAIAMSAEGEDMILEKVPCYSYEEMLREVHDFLPLSFCIESSVRLAKQYHHLETFESHFYTPKAATLRYKMVVQTPTGTNSEFGSLNLFWSPDHLSDEEVYCLLLTLPSMVWCKPLFVRQIHETLQENLTNIILRLSKQTLTRKTDFPVQIYILKDEKAYAPRLPEGYYLKKLDPQHAAHVVTLWMGFMSETVDAFVKLTNILPSVGVYKRRLASEIGSSSTEIKEIRREKGFPLFTENGDELVCYCVTKHGSDIGLTYTLEDHRRLGLAKIATLAIANELKDKGCNRLVMICNDNDVSKKIHERMGFRYYLTGFIILFAPEDYNLTFPS